MSFTSTILIALARFLAAVAFDGLIHTRKIGLDRIPREGGLLLIINHASVFDPPIVGHATPRWVEFMAMAELFRRPLFAWILHGLGAFPVDRARQDPTAAREAIRRLHAGRCVGIFPEGGVRLGPDSVLGGNPVFRPGAAALAAMDEVVILPVIVRGSRLPCRWANWFRRPTMSVTFGCPFCLWTPPGLSGPERRRRAGETLREELLKTVELGG
jgi:1-acyl-sn-glycerol-3-phosphate acyltransferase